MEVAAAMRLGRPSWVNRRTLLGLTLVGISVVCGWLVLESGKATYPVWTVVRDLPAGVALGRDDLRIEEVNLPPRLLDTYLSSSKSLAGMTLTRPVTAGELIPATWLASDDESASRVVTIPVDPEHAVGGALRPGEEVDVYATFDAGDPRARTVVLLRGAEVIDLVTSGGLVMGDRAIIGLTVAVGSEDAHRVAFASRTAELDVVRVDGVDSPNSSSSITTSDF